VRRSDDVWTLIGAEVRREGMSVPVRKPTTRMFITVRMSGAEICDEASGAAVGESGAGGRKGGSEKAR
jgi:hypothetical protein